MVDRWAVPVKAYVYTSALPVSTEAKNSEGHREIEVYVHCSFQHVAQANRLVI